MDWSILVGGGLAVACATVANQVRVRGRHYQRLKDERLEKMRATSAPRVREDLDLLSVREQFDRRPVAWLSPFLDGESFARLRDELLSVQNRVVRSYIPTHKKGGTVSYENLGKLAPCAMRLFHGAELQDVLRQVIGLTIMPTADHDQSSCSALFYTEPGDHIGWHYDHNFYNGRHFTVLLSIENRGEAGGVSASQFQWQDDGQLQIVDTRPNSLVVFEGQKVLHRATPTLAGDFRLMLSMTFATNPTLKLHREITRRCKDVAFFGLPALWR